MKCALHVHTTLSDGAMTPKEALKIYADLGFGAVAVTDHEFMLREHYASLVRSLPRLGMLVLVGVELDYAPWSFQHLLRIQGERETLHIMAHPASYYLELEEAAARLGSEPFPIDALEITHRGFYTPAYDVKEIPAPKLASDDAHEPGECGRAWIETRSFSDPDRLIRAVKAGDFKTAFFRRG